MLLYAFVWAPYICMVKMLIISNDFSSEVSGPVLLKFHAEPPWAGEWKIAKMGMVHWSKWLPCLYMVKTFKNLLQNQIMNKPWALIFAKLMGDRRFTKIAEMMVPVDIWPFYLQGQICFLMHLYGPYTFILKGSTGAKIVLIGNLRWLLSSLYLLYFPATVLFTCIKSWFFRNHLANFHQISHWSCCWNVIDSLFKWTCSIDCQAHIFFFKTKNCSMMIFSLWW